MAIPEEETDELPGPDTFRDQQHHEVFAAWRETDPVPWHVDSAGLGFWSLTKHADVQWASRDPETFVSGDGFTLIDIYPHDLRATRRPETPPPTACGP